MKHISLSTCICFIFLLNCNSNKTEQNLNSFLQNSSAIKGKSNYLNSPYVTAGNRVYMVGNQDGSFPELGWHIKGEMGGIWNHPIKLMDGFDINLIWENDAVLLDKAKSFVNYPMANKHTYELQNKNLTIERLQFVPDDKQGIVIQFILKNTSPQSQNFKFQFTGHSDLMPTWLGERTNMIDGDDEANYDSNLDTWLIKDKNNPWFVTFGADKVSVKNSEEKNNYKGNGVSRLLTYDISISAKDSKTLNFVIAGSYISKDETLATYKSIRNDFKNDFLQKQARYNTLANQSKLTIPDKKCNKLLNGSNITAIGSLEPYPKLEQA